MLPAKAILLLRIMMVVGKGRPPEVKEDPGVAIRAIYQMPATNLPEAYEDHGLAVPVICQTAVDEEGCKEVSTPERVLA